MQGGRGLADVGNREVVGRSTGDAGGGTKPETLFVSAVGLHVEVAGTYGQVVDGEGVAGGLYLSGCA